MKTKKIKDEIKAIIQELEKDYDMDYTEMYDCYLRNDMTIDYHIGVSYVEGMNRTLRLMEEEKK